MKSLSRLHFFYKASNTVKGIMESETKYKAGEIVFERIHPAQRLVINYYRDRIYYCKVQDHLHRKDLVFFEKDLMLAKVAVANYNKG